MKKVFISGGSEGIGWAIAKRFHASGQYEVGICARNAVRLAEAEQELPGLRTWACDLSDKQSVKNLVHSLNSEFGTLDVLINNGGVFLPGQMHTEEDDVFETLMSTNLYSAYYLSKGLIPAMMTHGEGTVINMCSIASITAYAHGGSYSVSKFGMHGFSKSLREEMKPHGIRVVAVLPGATYTRSWAGSDIPESRMMPAEDIAELVWTACALSPRTVVEDIVVRPQLGDL